MAAEVFAEIAVAEAGEDVPAVDPVRWVWSRAWKRLAALRPELFAVSPSSIPHVSGYQLAFLYGLKREPQAVKPLELSAEETIALNEGRRTLREWSGLRGFHCPGIHYQWDTNSLALSGATALWRYADIGGTSFDAYRNLRRVAIYPLDQIEAARTDKNSAACVASMLLHEETHAAINVAAGRPILYDRLLTKAIDEAATLLTDVTIYLTLSRGAPPSRRRTLRFLTTKPQRSRRDAMTLLQNLRPELGAEEWTRSALALAVEASRASGDANALRMLNRTTKRRWSERTWRRAFGLDGYWG